MRDQLAQTDKAAEIDAQVQEQSDRIRNANAEIDTLTEQKYALEAEYRKLEAEVGPVKYIAEFVYGEQAGTDLLEEAVRWVIVIIIFVFDPLAVLLLIASQYTFEIHRKRKDDQKELLRQQEWSEYERQRAQRIIDNPGYNIDDSTPSQEKEEVDGVDAATATGAGDNGRDSSDGMALAGKGAIDATEDIIRTDADMGDTLSKDDIALSYSSTSGMEYTKVQTDEDKSGSVDSKKKEVELLDESKEDKVLEVRKQQWDIKELDTSLAAAKSRWKDEHPEETIKFYKLLYLKGKIDKLPWEDVKYQPTFTNITVEDGYIQNSEQNENTLFNRLRRDTEN